MDCLSEMVVYRYVQGALSQELAKGVADHAHACASCRELLALLADGNQVDGHAPTMAVPRAETGAEARALLPLLGLDDHDRSGQLIADKYRIDRRLGAGGMGVVYEALNTWTGRRVALKLMHPWFSCDSETVSRFRREARSATRIKHPSIVDVLDMGEDPRDSALFIVQEFLTGATLREHLHHKGRFSVGEAASILEPIMEALVAAHDAGVIHRDVKPENIIVSVDHAGDPVPKLIDFGISKMTAGDVAAVLQTDRVLGTPLYMSPEQLRGSDSIDGRTDVWAVGVIMYEMLSGRRPFDADNRSDVTVQILTTEAAPLTDVPDAVADVVARALRRNPETRLPTMRVMLDAFRAARATSVPVGSLRRGWPLGVALFLSLLGGGFALALRDQAGRSPRPRALDGARAVSRTAPAVDAPLLTPVASPAATPSVAPAALVTTTPRTVAPPSPRVQAPPKPRSRVRSQPPPPQPVALPAPVSSPPSPRRLPVLLDP
jgi:serine/threonine-protein kinase